MTAAVNWLMGEEHLDPPWRFGPDGEHFEVEITGDPDCLVTFRKLHPATIEQGLERNPGIVATAMHCVNAMPYVCAAEPGPAHLPRDAARGRAGRPTSGRFGTSQRVGTEPGRIDARVHHAKPVHFQRYEQPPMFIPAKRTASYCSFTTK